MRKQNVIIWILSSLVVILVICVAFILLNENSSEKDINSYQDCVDAGYPVQESYPSRCVTPKGKSFTNPDEKVEDDTNSQNGTNSGEANANETEVKVYFSKGQDDPESMSAVTRQTARTDIEKFALEQLIVGPSNAEKEQGLTSPLSLTGNYVCTDKNELLPIDFDLKISNTEKKATLQLCRSIKDSGTLQDARIKSTITQTLKQFATIETVVILDSNGNCLADQSGLNLCKE